MAKWWKQLWCGHHYHADKNKDRRKAKHTRFNHCQSDKRLNYNYIYKDGACMYIDYRYIGICCKCNKLDIRSDRVTIFYNEVVQSGKLDDDYYRVMAYLDIEDNPFK